ncbi:hypothetical protein J1G42_03835 [Cellulomonas sp. zg-ZUI222]|uniref:hypothetical protein n=1 Tax=Cellulomonas wangleii TaxID=2816956 RepID=UPI001A94119D|nr:hypothetical protein [Cellulomonas wangleii]MBO0919954.1 hypothetical protein [Cellulomonas wangleii]
MTQDDSHPTSEGPTRGTPSDGTPAWLADRWADDAWRSPVAGGLVALLTLPALAMVLVGLVVLAVEGQATWLLVVAAALVTAALGALGAVQGLRRGHRGVVHRIALLTGVWGVLVVVAGVVVALTMDAPERGGVAVLLVLGGTYTAVLALGLWGAARLMPAPAEPVGAGTAQPDGPDTRPPAAGPAGDATEEELAEWPEWGGEPAGDGTDHPATRPGATEGRRATGSPAGRTSADASSLPGRPAAPTGRSTPPTPARTTGPTPARSTSVPTPGRSTPAVRARDEDVVEAVVVEAPAPSPAPPPQRRSVTSGGGTRRDPQPPGPATERIAKQDGDEGPPTQRIPPVVG